MFEGKHEVKEVAVPVIGLYTNTASTSEGVKKSVEGQRAGRDP